MDPGAQTDEITALRADLAEAQAKVKASEEMLVEVLAEDRERLHRSEQRRLACEKRLIELEADVEKANAAVAQVTRQAQLDVERVKEVTLPLSRRTRYPMHTGAALEVSRLCPSQVMTTLRQQMQPASATGWSGAS